jgi:hypothetical protein
MGVPGSDTPLGLRTQPRGNVLYVDNGHGDTSDNNDGTDPNKPLTTITQAIANTPTNTDTMIFVQSFSNALETWPITISKHKTHLFSNMWARGVGRTITPPGDTAGILITGDKVEVAGFEIGGGATHGCIEFSTTVQSWGAHIHHNRFGWMTAAQDGIRMTGAVDKVQFLIHSNEFNDKLTRDGVRIEQNSTRSVIFNNIFRHVAGVGINLVTLCTDIYAVHDNVFQVADSAVGEAIKCNINSTNCMFWGNQTMAQMAAMGNVPYQDLSAGNNHWGLNYAGLLAVFPV